MKYINNDPWSVKIRQMDVSQAHQFLCHDDGTECDGGATCVTNEHQHQVYNAAFEEVELTDNGDDPSELSWPQLKGLIEQAERLGYKRDLRILKEETHRRATRP